jgi:hypothetical protein
MLVLSFLVYVAARGRLGNYMAAFGITAGSGGGGAAGTGVSATGGGILGQASSFASSLSNLERNASSLFGGSDLGTGDYGGGSDPVTASA